jgi:hypothetical protein
LVFVHSMYQGRPVVMFPGPVWIRAFRTRTAAWKPPLLKSEGVEVGVLHDEAQADQHSL